MYPFTFLYLGGRGTKQELNKTNRTKKSWYITSTRVFWMPELYCIKEVPPIDFLTLPAQICPILSYNKVISLTGLVHWKLHLPTWKLPVTGRRAGATVMSSLASLTRKSMTHWSVHCVNPSQWIIASLTFMANSWTLSPAHTGWVWPSINPVNKRIFYTNIFKLVW